MTPLTYLYIGQLCVPKVVTVCQAQCNPQRQAWYHLAVCRDPKPRRMSLNLDFKKTTKLFILTLWPQSPAMKAASPLETGVGTVGNLWLTDN